MYGQFNTYIDDPKMISKLLCFDWIILKDKWPNCPQNIYDRIKKGEFDEEL